MRTDCGRLWYSLLVAACGFAVDAAQAQPRTPTARASAHASLHVVPVAVTGTRVDMLVTLTIDPGWHVSWRNPGETGLPTQLSWSLPDGVRLTAERWPVPIVRHTTVGATHTMEGTVPWLVTLVVKSPEARSQAKSPAAASVAVARRTITLTMRYGVCREICIPARLSIDVPLPIDGAAVVSPVPAALRMRLVEIGAAIPARRLSATALCVARLPTTGSRAHWELVADTGMQMDAAVPLRARRGFAVVATIPADAHLMGRPRMLFVRGARAIEAPLDLAATARGCETP